MQNATPHTAMQHSANSAKSPANQTETAQIAQTARPAGIGGGPLFTEEVATNGYLWWYIDALSDDGQYGLTIIAFIGSVFSPYYAHERRRDKQLMPFRLSRDEAGVDPMDHCAINIALYSGVDGGAGSGSSATANHIGPHNAHWWAMTECPRHDVKRSPTRFEVATSAISWDGVNLTIDIDEKTVPFPYPAPFATKLRGKVTVTPLAVFTDAFDLDAESKHQWRPIAPISRVKVEMAAPDLHWQGAAYVDSNIGTAPLEDSFMSWDWARTKPSAMSVSLNSAATTLVVYDVQRLDGSNLTLAKQFTVNSNVGQVSDFAAPPHAPLPTSGWGIARATACDVNATCGVVKTVEDTPFYARSIVSSTINGTPATMFHESLSLARFSTRWVQMLLPFKMRRRAEIIQ
jgi:carotenoid 1,2-hydratase